MSHLLDLDQLSGQWRDALREDGWPDDITSRIAVEPKSMGEARVVARHAGVFAGRALLVLLNDAEEPRVTVEPHVSDGDQLVPGTLIASLRGCLRDLLGIERTLLNFLQRLCGVATLTRRYVDAVAGTKAGIYDTRKTIPGWRQLDKYAVRCGGGHNHRMGLHDAILIKDNHLAGVETARLAAAVFEMLNEAAALDRSPAFIECEVDTLEQFDELLKVVGINVILLDNFSIEQMAEAVARRDAMNLRGKLELEASGGVDLAGVRLIAETGVERIAVGAITHSAPALDIGIDMA